MVPPRLVRPRDSSNPLNDPFLTVPALYLEGLRAAARPDDRTSAVPPPAEPPPVSAESTPAAAVAPHENLSPEEQIKRRLHPLDSFPRLLDCASANRPPDPDDRFRFQWFGLFYQAPEQDAFTLRLRLPGGRLRPFQLAGLADLTQRFASGQVTFNSQGGLDLPGVPVTAAAETLAQVKSIGLSTLHTGGDCVQAIRGGELDNPPVYPLVCALEQALAYAPACSNLPLPCEIVFENVDDPAAVHPSLSIDTILLRALPDASFLLHVPGESNHGFFLPFHGVVPACLELLRGWAAGADRSSREKAGLSPFLTGLGADGICALHGGAKRAPQPPDSKRQSLPVKSNSPPGLPVPDGRLLSAQLTALEQGCREQNWQEIRLRRNHLYVAGTNGIIPDAATVMRRATAGTS